MVPPDPEPVVDEEATSSDRPAEVLDAWIEEAERRYARFLRGETQAIPAAEALERVRARLLRP
jgi:hypothetical protein